MAVTFNRAQLMRVAKSALAEDIKAQKVYREEVDKFLAQHARNNHRPDQLRKLRDYITAALKRGNPIIVRDIRKALGVSDVENLFYAGPPSITGWEVTSAVVKPAALLGPNQRTEINAMLKVLEAATGETITANEMKLLGFKNLYPVFAAASGEAAK